MFRKNASEPRSHVPRSDGHEPKANPGQQLLTPSVDRGRQRTAEMHALSGSKKCDGPRSAITALLGKPVEISFAIFRSAERCQGEIFARILRRSQHPPQNQQKKPIHIERIWRISGTRVEHSLSRRANRSSPVGCQSQPLVRQSTLSLRGRYFV